MKIRYLPLIILLFAFQTVKAQTLVWDAHISMKNCVLVAPDTFQFEIWIATDTITTFTKKLQATQLGINFNIPWLNGGTPTSILYINNTALSAVGMQNHTPNMATPGHWRVAAQVELSAANATVIPSLSAGGIRYGTYRIINSVPFSTSINPNFNFQLVNAPGKTRTTCTAFIGTATSALVSTNLWTYTCNGNVIITQPSTITSVTCAFAQDTVCFGSGYLTPIIVGGTPPYFIGYTNGSSPFTYSNFYPGDSIPIIVNTPFSVVSIQYIQDSSLSLLLNINASDTIFIQPNTTVLDTISTCNSYTWPINGITYTTSGVYTYLQTTTLCPITHILNLSLQDTIYTKQNAVACDSFFWPQRNTTYYTTGIYFDTSTTALGCTQIDTLDLIINNAQINLLIDSACVDYVWYINNTIYTQSGIYIVQTAGSNGCPTSNILDLTMVPLPVVEILPGNDTVLCKSSSITLNSTNSALLYNLWYKNGIVLANSLSFVPPDSGTYVLYGKDYDFCFVTDTIHISYTGYSPIIVQNATLLTCTNTSGASNYQWTFNGNAVGTNDSVLNINSNGTYIIAVTDSLGCMVFDTIQVINLSLYDNDVQSFFSIYPNPTNKKVWIEIADNVSSEVHFQLQDLLGKVLWQVHSKNQKNFSIDLSEMSLSDGIYFIIGEQEQRVFKKKILLQQ
ncbi:MAG: T9SS type A sorting domain-containing protein [Chitinophagaceae bacterium]